MTSINKLILNQYRWYRLDNAAKLYSAIHGKTRPGVFRLSAELSKSIQPSTLQKALNLTLTRFPGFAVKLRAGLFWHYFKHSSDVIQIQEDVSNPCTDIFSKKNKGFLLRVRYHKNRIAVEFFHSVTDGAGALIFLNTLVAQYLSLLGYLIPAAQGILVSDQDPILGEFQDSFQAFAGQAPSRKRQNLPAYHIKGTTLPLHSLRTITGSIPVESLKKESKKMGVSITEYLVSVYLFVLYKIQLSENPRRFLPIKIQVPVDLRRFHPTNTLRNFSAYVIPSLDPNHGDFSFQEIVKSVHHFMRFEVTEKLLRSQVATNLKSEKNLIIRIMPLFIKNYLINLVYKFVGPSSFTTTISNLGLIEIPEEMRQHVKGYELTLGATRDTNLSCGMLGYKNTIHICFSRVIKETNVEKEFLSFLVSSGIPVAVGSNRE
jgi:NRPS condensation-like uncharacterized protein